MPDGSTPLRNKLGLLNDSVGEVDPNLPNLSAGAIETLPRTPVARGNVFFSRRLFVRCVIRTDLIPAWQLDHAFSLWGKCMTVVSSSRVALLLTCLCCLTGSVRSDDGGVELIPTELDAAPPVLTGDAEQDKYILTAGIRGDGDSSPERPRVELVEDGTSSRRSRREAVEAMRLDRLPWQNRQLVQEIVDEVSIFRRLPSFRCEVAPDVHDYFVHHPEVAVSIWRAMGISQLKMWQTGDWSYEMDTRDGTTGSINVLYRARESCLILCRGMFKSPYLQNTIAARAVMHLRTSFSEGEDGRRYATHHADMFVAFPSQKVETVARLISPLSNVIIDRNFQEISLFLHVMWLAMGRQPGWVEQIAGDLDGISDGQRDRLIKLTAQVYVQTQSAIQRRAGQAVTLDRIRPPTQGSGTTPVSAIEAAPAATKNRNR